MHVGKGGFGGCVSGYVIDGSVYKLCRPRRGVALGGVTIG